MSKEKSKDVVDQAVNFIRKHYVERGVDIRSAHAHAAVSHYLGYNSKIALKSDSNFDPNDTNLLCYHETCTDKLALHIPLMKPTPLQGLSLQELEAVIYAGLAPACECCALKSLTITPLGHKVYKPDGWVCRPCADHESESYARCQVCGDNYVYRTSELNHRGECAVHNGESVLIQRLPKTTARVDMRNPLDGTTAKLGQAMQNPLSEMQAMIDQATRNPLSEMQAMIDQATRNPLSEIQAMIDQATRNPLSEIQAMIDQATRNPLSEIQAMIDQATRNPLSEMQAMIDQATRNPLSEMQAMIDQATRNPLSEIQAMIDQATRNPLSEIQAMIDQATRNPLSEMQATLDRALPFIRF